MPRRGVPRRPWLMEYDFDVVGTSNPLSWRNLISSSLVRLLSLMGAMISQFGIKALSPISNLI